MATSGTELSNLILPMLSRMTTYFYSMVDPRKGRFYYRCLPESGRLIHQHCPIRDLGSAWDTTTLLTFLKVHKSSTVLFDNMDWTKVQAQLSTTILNTIQAYNGSWLEFRDATGRPCVAISSKVLREPTDIAHSAFLILATNGALRLNILEVHESNVPLDSLVNGILSMQRDSGAFAIRFGDHEDIWRGIEFYPGEAMLSLLDAYELNDGTKVLSPTTRNAIVPAVKRAFLYYSDYYRQGNVDSRYTSFFGNWQVQAFARLFDVVQREEQARQQTEVTPTQKQFSTAVAEYIFELCDAIVSSTPWKDVYSGRYRNLSTVEIACGLEALAEGIRVAEQPSSWDAFDRLGNYRHHATKAIEFLAAVQNQVPIGATGSGGLGYGLDVSEQRLDVTGHAVNALVKAYSVLPS